MNMLLVVGRAKFTPAGIQLSAGRPRIPRRGRRRRRPRHARQRAAARRAHLALRCLARQAARRIRRLRRLPGTAQRRRHAAAAAAGIGGHARVGRPPANRRAPLLVPNRPSRGRQLATPPSLAGELFDRDAGAGRCGEEHAAAGVRGQRQPEVHRPAAAAGPLPVGGADRRRGGRQPAHRRRDGRIAGRRPVPGGDRQPPGLRQPAPPARRAAVEAAPRGGGGHRPGRGRAAAPERVERVGAPGCHRLCAARKRAGQRRRHRLRAGGHPHRQRRHGHPRGQRDAGHRAGRGRCQPAAAAQRLAGGQPAVPGRAVPRSRHRGAPVDGGAGRIAAHRFRR